MLFYSGKLYSLTEVSHIADVRLTDIIFAVYRDELTIKRQANRPFIIGAEAEAWTKRFRTEVMRHERELAEVRQAFKAAVKRGDGL